MTHKIDIKNLNLYYDEFHALKSVNMVVGEKNIIALIGPSGCGKSTLLRTINRMNDLIEGVRITGEVFLDGNNIYDPGMDLYELRKRVGMVFQRPNPFAKSVSENVAFGLRVAQFKNKKKIAEIVERSLRAAGLWDELKDKLNRPALDLPLYQQQRLCIARLLAVEPEVILMDEPCSALDPIATMKIEEMMVELKRNYNIIIVTHNMQQAARVSDLCGYMLLGEMIEFNKTSEIFTNPRDKRTQDYITGRFG
ncbi:MAG: phosphate ABC transporter ATP-binding protein [Spirochaetes bacterium RBG_13_51_14]|nr:MAG: phosphate ABC transporter ATP-binding protein [Spirochaetes bacterium RBG_13_51_14]